MMVVRETPRGTVIEHDERSAWGSFWRKFLGPVFYFLGLNGPNGRPSNSRIVYTLTVLANLGILLHETWHESTDLWFTIHALAVMAFSMGVKSYSDFLNSKLATSLGGAATEAVKHEAEVILARRQASSQEHADTEGTL